MDINEGLIKSDNKILECFDKFCQNKTRTISGEDQIKPRIKQSNKNNIKKRENNYKLFKHRLFFQTRIQIFS